MKPSTNYLDFVQNHINPIFVSGCPRSGTTICHALLCTSPNVNDYVPESSFLTGILNNFVTGLNSDEHNVDYFGSKQNFIDYGLEQIATLIMHSWLRFESPEFLCLKDPNMYAHMDWLHQAFPRVHYVFTIRDPAEVISSRVSVERKYGRTVDDNVMINLSSELVKYFDFLIALHQNHADRLTIVHYDEIMSGNIGHKFSKISNSITINNADVWKSKFFHAFNEQSPWISKNYGVSVENAQKSPIILDEGQINIVNTICDDAYTQSCKIMNH
ncbi:sulfotransferase [Sphingobium sp. DEHP117]|uniref:sulfotransferase family protein n=1 Tax=Sphingobium sp. DEHP117 TaxID=2993436 RepID=UPI0027D4DBEF|nr:sulfotransferase [Sphingobium sp. DEHP117]MDQ4421391.1 sulfotransferase [Sphingobium sp. DEHP117]